MQKNVCNVCKKCIYKMYVIVTSRYPGTPVHWDFGLPN